MRRLRCETINLQAGAIAVDMNLLRLARGIAALRLHIEHDRLGLPNCGSDVLVEAIKRRAAVMVDLRESIAIGSLAAAMANAPKLKAFSVQGLPLINGRKRCPRARVDQNRSKRPIGQQAGPICPHAMTLMDC